MAAWSGLAPMPCDEPYTDAMFPSMAWDGAIPWDHSMDMWQQPRHAGHHSMYGNGIGYSHSAASSLRGSALARRHAEWLDRFAKSHLERIPDSRPGRQTKPLKLWRTKLAPMAMRSPEAAKPPELPLDFLSDLYANVCDLALEPRESWEDRQGTLDRKERNPSLGADVVQKMLALATSEQKCALIYLLTSEAKKLLHHDSGCFVVSQLLREGIDGDASVGLAAVGFMAAAHECERPEVYEANLLVSMTHTHANHSLKMWVQLLALLEKSHKGPEVSGPLQAMLAVVHDNAIDLVEDCQGVRTVNGLLEQFGTDDAGKVKPILEKLVGNKAMLDELIKDEFANFAINIAVDLEPDRISQAVRDNFRPYSTHEYANYVVQKCISSSACENHLPFFAEAFHRNRDRILKDGKNGEAIRKGIERAERRERQKRPR